MKITLSKLRTRLRKFLITSKIPLLYRLGQKFMTEEQKEMVVNFVKHFEESLTEYREHVEELSTLSPHCAHWLMKEQIDKVVGRQMVAIDGLNNMYHFLHRREHVVLFFERYVTTIETLQATLVAFVQIPELLFHHGLADRDTGEIDDLSDVGINMMIDLISGHIADALIQMSFDGIIPEKSKLTYDIGKLMNIEK